MSANHRKKRTGKGQGRYGRRVQEVSSGSLEFDMFRDRIAAQPALVREVESALHVNLMTANPSDPGARFITGGGVEWILACAAYQCGLPLLPDGHSATGHDLRAVMANAKALWSVKSQSTPNPSAFRISNGMGGGGLGFTEPTIFLSPNLPGLVYASPTLHPDVKAAERETTDAITIAHGVIKTHAAAHPECVIPMDIPANPGAATEDPFLAYAKGVIDPARFPLLARLFVDAAPAAGDLLSQVQALVAMRDAGQISEEQFGVLVTRMGMPS